ncbi:MAG: hypothetical protein ABSC05_22260 [Candidatus Solibacter sp.]|jgi:hypothetical protein
MSAVYSDPETIKTRELGLQRMLMVWIITGLAFMLLPGTFLGVWNLIAIAGQRTAAQIDPTWIQAHGHAQIFGWIGTFILGIGFYSLTKMGRIPEFAIGRAWTSWALWTVGVTLRWATNLWQWQWRWLLPVSAVLELSAFLLFFAMVRGHRPAEGPAAQGAAGRPVWMIVVVTGSIGFLASLAANLAVAIQSAVAGGSPAIAHDVNQRVLVLFTWAFPVVTIWGFSARWLPVFLGLAGPSDRMLLTAVAVNLVGIGAALTGWWISATAAFLVAAGLSGASLRIFQPSVKPPKTVGVHFTFPLFVRFAYGWLLISAVVSLSAALWDKAGGLWGASRHALTVGFMATMVFSIGQRVLPAFCGMRVLYSPKLMFCSLAMLNLGCLLRIASEVGAYESYVPSLWPLLPVSAVIEMIAVTVFAGNLLLTFRQPPAHLVGVE